MSNKTNELFQQLGDAVNKGDRQSTLAALAKFMQELGLLPDQQPGLPQQSGTDNGQSNQDPNPQPSQEDFDGYEGFNCARIAAREIWDEQSRKSQALEQAHYANASDEKAKKDWHEHLNATIARQSRKLLDDLVSRLSFMQVARTKYDVGHKSGRITPRCSVRVASGDEKPFAKKDRPGAPANVTLVIAHDVSGSMGNALRDQNQNHSLRLVYALQALQEVYPSINVLVVPWSSRASCHDGIEISGITQLDQYLCGTVMASAFESLYESESYKDAVRKGDAIVGVMITDGETDSSDRQKCKVLMAKNKARSEEWCCAVIGQWNARANRGEGEYGTAKLQEVFGAQRTFGFGSVPASIPMIAKTIQKTITRAESRRK